jgi:ribosomal protein S19
MKLSIINGQVFVNGKLTTDPELIGYALLDFAETCDNDNISITLKDADVFVEKID